jgi:hypothetical protein
MGVVKAGVSDLHAEAVVLRSDLTNLKSDSSRMLDDIANSVVYLNQNVEEKTDALRKSLEEVSDAVRVNTQDREASKNILLRQIEDLDLSAASGNCKVDFT